MLIYLIRHGESKAQTGEALGLDTPLSDSGIAQAEQAGKELQGFQPDRIYVSPLIRAMDTLEHLHLICKEEPVADSRIVENSGEPDDFPEKRAESFINTLNELAEQGTYHTVLVVAHSMFFNTLMNVFLQCSGNSFARMGNARMSLL